MKLKPRNCYLRLKEKTGSSGKTATSLSLLKDIQDNLTISGLFKPSNMQESATCGIQQKISHIAPFCIQKPKCKCIVLVSTGVFFSQSQASCFLLPVFPLSQAGRLLSY